MDGEERHARIVLLLREAQGGELDRAARGVRVCHLDVERATPAGRRGEAAGGHLDVEREPGGTGLVVDGHGAAFYPVAWPGGEADGDVDGVLFPDRGGCLDHGVSR